MTSKRVSLDLPRDMSEIGAKRDRFLIRLRCGMIEKEPTVYMNFNEEDIRSTWILHGLRQRKNHTVKSTLKGPYTAHVKQLTEVIFM